MLKYLLIKLYKQLLGSLSSQRELAQSWSWAQLRSDLDLFWRNLMKVI